MELGAGAFNKIVQFQKLAADPSSGAYEAFGVEAWARFIERRPTSIEMFDLDIYARTGTLTVRDDDFIRALSTLNRVSIDGYQFDIRSVNAPVVIDGTWSFELIEAFSAETIIALLDRQIATQGETVTFYRWQTSPKQKLHEVTTRAIVRPTETEDTVGEIAQDMSTIIVSPTNVAAILPFKKGDKAVIVGKERNVEIPKNIRMDDRIVRVELIVAG